MLLEDRPYAPRTPAEARAAGVAIVYQEPQLCPHLSVAENIGLGSEPSRFGFVDRRALRTRAHDALAQLSDERIAVDRPVSSLSPGERQLVAIARALSQARSHVLILDEPTSSLGAQDTLARAKDFYANAAYEEALNLLQRLGASGSPVEGNEVAAYQVFCLVALGRSDEAKQTIETLVKTDTLRIHVDF